MKKNKKKMKHDRREQQVPTHAPPAFTVEIEWARVVTHLDRATP